MRFKTFIAVLFATIIIVFSLQNAEVTEVKFLFWSFPFSRVIVILGSFLVGILVGVLITLKKRFRVK